MDSKKLKAINSFLLEYQSHFIRTIEILILMKQYQYSAIDLIES